MPQRSNMRIQYYPPEIKYDDLGLLPEIKYVIHTALQRSGGPGMEWTRPWAASQAINFLSLAFHFLCDLGYNTSLPRVSSILKWKHCIK